MCRRRRRLGTLEAVSPRRSDDPGHWANLMYDALLHWISERGQGSLTSFRRAHDWLKAGHPATAGAEHWTWTLESLQSLGHVEIDWSARRWQVAPSTIVTMVGGGGYPTLC